MNTFNDTTLSEPILKAITEMGFETPTPIQAQTIPHLLSEKGDIIATAQTGTGKTAAFGLPSIELTHINQKDTQTLVLCPTRELCVQITKDLTKYAKYIKGLNVVAIYGGASMDTQIRALKKGAHIVVGTPGRTKDLIKRKKLIIGNVRRLILDEADEMLSMGFKDDLDAILSNTPSDKNTLLFSATMSKRIVSITKQYMNDPVQIAVARVNMGADNVKHIYYMVQAKDRYAVLKRIADMNPNIYGITFCRTRRETKEIANKLMHDGYNADAIHGDLSQAQRDEVMGRFRKGKLHMLVATDVAARGLDVDDLTHVINFNLPDDSEIYVHRSGRTGRAGKSGISIAIIHTRDMRKIKEIERISSISFTKELVPSGKDICQKQLYALIDKIEKVHVDEKQIEPFLPAIYEKLDWLDREQLIKHFVSAEFNRFLSYYKNARDINVSDHRSDRKKNKSNKKDKRSHTSHTNFFINLGSNNNLEPVKLIGLINQALKSGSVEIGRIEIMKKFSFFEVDDRETANLLKGMNGMNYEGTPVSVEVSKEKPAFKSSSKNKSYKKKNRGKRDGWKRSRKKRRSDSNKGKQRRK